MALHLYRRHLKSCSQTSATYRRCQCPMWVRGTLNHTKIRMSLDQTDWDAATRTISAWTKAGAIGQTFDLHARTIRETITAFMADCDARGLAPDTKKKYRNLLERRLLDFCSARGLSFMSDLNLDVITRFRGTWADGPLTKSKTQERLRWFFGWCLKRKWVEDNPTEGLSHVKVPPNPTLPFTRAEQSAILHAVDRYLIRHRARMKAFVLVLRWTGLRIRDVCTLEWSRVQNGKVFLYTQKTGQPVSVPVPKDVTDALMQLKQTGRFVFWSGTGSPKSTVSNWQRALRTLYRSAGVVNGHAHRFRDTFAVELLMAGVDMTDVSILLGHSSIKTTERHYAAWVNARQIRLEVCVQRTWPGAAPNASETDGRPDPLPTQESATPREV